MSTHHAAPVEIVNLATWADDLPKEHSKAIVKTNEMELARLILPPGEGIEDQHVDGPLVVHCLSGSVEFDAMGKQQELGDGELAYLPAEEPFTLKARRHALVLLTFVFTNSQ